MTVCQYSEFYYFTLYLSCIDYLDIGQDKRRTKAKKSCRDS